MKKYIKPEIKETIIRMRKMIAQSLTCSDSCAYEDNTYDL